MFLIADFFCIKFQKSCYAPKFEYQEEAEKGCPGRKKCKNRAGQERRRKRFSQSPNDP